MNTPPPKGSFFFSFSPSIGSSSLSSTTVSYFLLLFYPRHRTLTFTGFLPRTKNERRSETRSSLPTPLHARSKRSLNVCCINIYLQYLSTLRLLLSHSLIQFSFFFPQLSQRFLCNRYPLTLCWCKTSEDILVYLYPSRYRG